MVHTLFSIVAPLASSRPVDVRQGDLAFENVASLHFASVVVFDKPAGAADGEFPRHVVLEVCTDGTLDDCLAALLFETRRREAIADLFEGCSEFGDVRRHDRASAAFRQGLERFLRQHVVHPHLFHIGSPGQRLDQIKAGAALREALEDSIARLGGPALSRQSPLEIVARLRRRLRVPPSSKTHWHLDLSTVASREYAWFSDPVVRWPSRLRHWTPLLVIVAVVLAVPVGLALTGGWRPLLVLMGVGAASWWLYWKWLTGRHPGIQPTPEQLHALTEQEDEGVHNHMASLALLKPGLLRRVAIRVVLRGFNLAYRTLYTDITPGRLQGLPTIHFAQWSIVPLEDSRGTRREALMFLSNYDGSWQTYLDDFLEFLFAGVVMIWGNAATFPSPVDGRTFKGWARTRMAPFALWHDLAYPTLSVSNIQNNNQLRIGLLRPPRTEHAARLWLARLGAVKAGSELLDDDPGRLPTDDMQGLLLRGYGALPYAAYALLRLDGGGAGRRWLQELVGCVTDGRELDKREQAKETEAVNVAFTYRGLVALGLPRPVLERFPQVFKEGMAPIRDDGRALLHRSRILGDVGDSAPERWAWGGRDQPERHPDILLMLYGRTPEALERLCDRHLDAFRDVAAGSVIYVLRSAPLGHSPAGAAMEHFGFVDGLSQPRMEGTWQASDDAVHRSPADIVAPGEFVLGYEAGDGSLTPGVPVADAHDPDELLPPAPGMDDMRDFGQNGTFLVARQLSQHVAGFRKFTAEAAGLAPAQYESRAAELVAARIVGRWRSGAPLAGVAAADHPNGFSFAADPHGFTCPIGAHIRRANPRDSLGADATVARASANRHRLLRRGRPYGSELPAGELDDGSEPRGLMFIGLNADTERQFEFVQQNWINSPVFGGLYAERDPLLGTIDDQGHFTVQASPVSTRMSGLSRFVRVVGGGYFFMPGISALRYLGQLHAGIRHRTAALAAVPAATPVQQSALGHVLALAAAALPGIRLAWAIRFPLLLATALVLIPFMAAWAPLFALPLFLTTPPGAALIAFLASCVAWAVMVMLRLVLMYGTRVGLLRSRWTRSATWRQVLAFQALALPVVIAAVHFTAADVASTTASYGETATRLSMSAAAGLALGLLALGIAGAVQSLRPGGRPDLFLPPVPRLLALAGRIRRVAPVHWVVGGVASLGTRIARSVPEEIGVGFIDYRNRRILPGHAFAAVLASLVGAVYVAGFFLLDPSGDGPRFDVPAVAYVLFMLLAIGWLLSAVAFFLDRYRLPTVLTVVVGLIVVATVARPDHVFEVGDPIEPAASPREIAASADARRPGKIVIVASEGFGLASSAWTAEVLTRLAGSEHGREFARAVRLISASSGAALGATHFAGAFAPGGFAAHPATSLENIRARACTPSSAEGWWGLVYPDLLRAFVPPLVPAHADRGWAMEQAWRRAFPPGPEPTLSGWRRDVAAGWRPATVFGVTSVESGEHGLLATYRTRSRSPDGPDYVTRGRDVAVVTAARLSASFPYVSPAARAAGDPEAYHFTDGGFWDNSGLMAALDWIEDAGHDPDRVLLVEIRSSPVRRRTPPESRLWVLEAFGPVRTLVEVRYDGQRARNDAALRQFMRTSPIEHVVFELNDTRIPLTWNLRRTDLRHLEDAWARGDNQRQRDRVRAFFSTE